MALGDRSAASLGRRERSPDAGRRDNGQTRQELAKADHDRDIEFGFPEINHGPPKLGWMINMEQTSVFNEHGAERSAVTFYFMQDDGSGFSANFLQKPYFYIRVKEGLRREVDAYLMRKHEGLLSEVETVEKEDLGMRNHLSGLKGSYLKLLFDNVGNLMTVRKSILPIVNRNKSNARNNQMFEHESRQSSYMAKSECLRGIEDIREYDVPYVQRVCIDQKFRAGLWYEVSYTAGVVTIERRADILEVPDLRVLAFDIETTKSPLKFPVAEQDCIMMISYMADGDGFLIVNREIVSEDIEDFDYTPKPEFPGPFIIFNESDEKELLDRFLDHVAELRPHVFVTYNGDFFDWPFVETRCRKHGINMHERIGIKQLTDDGEYGGRFAVHLDAFCWVRRDSYLPQGSQGLKAVTKALLSYNPLELDPEDMLPFASSQPQVLASYSVSDAVATYYLYKKYVHLFVFSLCTIIPMGPADVLRKGSGTLCEQLLMVEAFSANIICPNKAKSAANEFWNGHMLESQTYIGGHVECLESGVFREDLPVKFRMDPEALQTLIDEVPDIIRFAVEVEWKEDIDQVTNSAEIEAKLVEQLSALRDDPVIECEPLIYHLDVGAMYPNIILTNRLQPMAIVDRRTCAACDFNIESDICQRNLNWSWRGRLFPASRSDVAQQKQQLEMETFTSVIHQKVMRFGEMPREEQDAILLKRIKEYSHKVYKRGAQSKTEERTATICQRENSFYVDTVRAFRDRRYEYKGLKKHWSSKLKKAKDLVEKQAAQNMVLLYDSMQLAHKCILNSFYGYVMRKGARWHSIEMAGVVTHTGANIIKDARIITEKLGRALELDTDGIWCLLPKAFPENFELVAVDENGKVKKFTFSYPGTMLNRIVEQNYTNHQYLTLTDPAKRTYARSRENSIFFEVDGPYRAMVLPAAQAEGKTLKKRYAVFNKDGSLAELKGFELKRRGELKLIKVFQAQVFPTFLEGTTLEECYAAVGKIANHWVDVLTRRGVDLDDEEVFDLISESKNMSGSLASYGDQRSTSITTAKRLAQFLGASMVKDKGLNCKFILSKKPEGDPVSSRAVPTAIFSAEESIKVRFLRKWLKDPQLQDFDVRSILDWDYYLTRLGSAIQKIITIPAALQQVKNPVDRVAHPDWLLKRVREANSGLKQLNVKNFFGASTDRFAHHDIEDSLGGADTHKSSTFAAHATTRKRALPEPEPEPELEPEPMPLGKDAPDRDVDFKAWHSFEKKRWARLREQMQQRKKQRSEFPKRAEQPKSEGSVRRHDDESSRAIWHIIQIAKNRLRPGEFQLFVAISGKLHSVRLEVPRQFYIQWAEGCVPHDCSNLVEMKRILPRGRTPQTVHQMTTSEEIFIDSFQERAKMLSSGSALGLYETLVPLWFRTIVGLGCFCRPKIPLSQILRSGCSLDELQMLMGCDVNDDYLAGIDLRQIFLYSAGNEQRGIVAIMIPQTDQDGEPFVAANVFIVAPRGRPADKPNLASFVPGALEALGRERDTPVDEIRTTLTVVKSTAKALQNVSTTISSLLRSSSWRNTVVISQSSINETLLVDLIPALGSRIPVIAVAPNSDDDHLEALSWLTNSCKRLVARFLTIPDMMAGLKATSEYGLIPLANLSARGRDQSKLVLDVMYSRLLLANKHVLWASESDTADLGAGCEYGLGNSDERFFAAELTNPEIAHPGCYRQPCVEIVITNLAVSALLASDVSALDQSDFIETANTHNDAIVDDDHRQVFFRRSRAGANSSTSSAPMHALEVLRTLAKNMSDEILKNNNALVDSLFAQLYVWIRSNIALLYEPALQRIVHELMNKVFLQVCAEFRHVGAEIVYASFSKLIVHTRKPTVQHALAYVKYASNGILEQDHFHTLVFQYDHVWEALVFVDPANFAGVEHNHSASLPAITDNDIVMSEEDPSSALMIRGDWNMAEFLPRLAQHHFLLLVNEFLQIPYEEAQNHLDDDSWTLSSFMVEFLSSHITRRVFEMTNEIVQLAHGPGYSADERADATVFPELPGAHIQLDNAALEFVKMAIHVLSLDSGIEDQVESLRASAMQLIGIGAFSKEAVYDPVCRTFVLPDVSCAFCGDTRDLDMCRDPNLLNGDWRCPLCQNEYCRDEIELALVGVVQRRSTVFQVQDLICSECRTVETSNVGSCCALCAGTLECRVPPAEFLQGMHTFRSIAQFFKLEWLQETIETLMQ